MDGDYKTQKSTAEMLRTSISKWYYALRNLALIGLMSVLIYIGIRIILSSTANEKAKYKSMIADWIVAMCLLFVLHYIMVFSVNIVEKITDALEKSTATSFAVIKNSKVANAVKENSQEIGDIVGLSKSNVEEMVKSDCVYWPTDFMGIARINLQQLGDSEDDTVAIKASYTAVYLVLIFFTMFYLVFYIKRVIYLAFLTLIAPLITLTYPIDKINDGQAQGFNIWLKEYIFNLLIQPFHLILYTILISSAIEFATENIIYTCVALGFMMPAEKLLRKMFNFNKAETANAFSGAAAGAFAANALGKVSKLIGSAGSKKKIGKPENDDDQRHNIRIPNNGLNGWTDALGDGNNNQNGDGGLESREKMLEAYDENFGTDEYDFQERDAMARENQIDRMNQTQYTDAEKDKQRLEGLQGLQNEYRQWADSADSEEEKLAYQEEADALQKEIDELQEKQQKELERQQQMEQQRALEELNNQTENFGANTQPYEEEADSQFDEQEENLNMEEDLDENIQDGSIYMSRERQKMAELQKQQKEAQNGLKQARNEATRKAYQRQLDAVEEEMNKVEEQQKAKQTKMLEYFRGLPSLQNNTRNIQSIRNMADRMNKARQGINTMGENIKQSRIGRFATDVNSRIPQDVKNSLKTTGKGLANIPVAGAKKLGKAVFKRENIGKVARFGLQAGVGAIGAGLGATIGIATGDAKNVGQYGAVGAGAGWVAGGAAGNVASKGIEFAKDAYKEGAYGKEEAARRKEMERLAKDKKVSEYVSTNNPNMNHTERIATEKKMTEYMADTGVRDMDIISKAMKLETEGLTTDQAKSMAYEANKYKDRKLDLFDSKERSKIEKAVSNRLYNYLVTEKGMEEKPAREQANKATKQKMKYLDKLLNK